MKILSKTKNILDDGSIYEVSYLLIPTLPEEKLDSEVALIKKTLGDQGVLFISEEFPKLKPLSYTMEKTVGTGKQKFDRGYFGWFKFEAIPATLNVIKNALDTHNHIFRFLIIKTVRESPTSPREQSKESDRPVSKITDFKDAKAITTPVSIAEIDKSIEELIAE